MTRRGRWLRCWLIAAATLVRLADDVARHAVVLSRSRRRCRSAAMLPTFMLAHFICQQCLYAFISISGFADVGRRAGSGHRRSVIRASMQQGWSMAR